MKMRKNELSSAQAAVELALLELDEVSGGDRDLQLRYLNWIKQYYVPWMNMHFGEGRILVA